MTLKELEIKWRAYLKSEDCPPVPGLAPLSDKESEEIRQLVNAQLTKYSSHATWKVLFALIEAYPACMVVWLARKAGEAYEAGAFWEKFGELIGITISLNRREELAHRIRSAARGTMRAWLPPQELGGRSIVDQLLHLAGLPLDRCAGFSQHVRKVERTLGLPDLADPESGDQLREAVLESLHSYPVPTLKRALRGPAGPSICEVALRVVLRGDFAGVNPRLGEELEREFQNASRESLRRSALLPFLRLGNDLGSLEIVGPRQDSLLIGERGLTWIVDGQRYPTPRTEELVIVVTDRPRVVLELSGLKHGNMPPRSFALRLDDLDEPFILFDERTRKHRRTAGLISPGSYWLLHRNCDTLFGATQTYQWPEDERAISRFTLRPGVNVRLESDEGGPWSFVASATPSFEPLGSCITQEEGEPIYFNWIELPSVWLPNDEVNPERLSEWEVSLVGAGQEQQWPLLRTDEESEGMVKCHVESNAFLNELSPGMYRFECTLRRGERGRAEARAAYWYWQGLREHTAREFQILAHPRNLVSPECRGFALEAFTIRHVQDQNRSHRLCFQVGDDRATFCWSQPGLFLESLERTAGTHARVRSHRLGDTFSASIGSTRWLRIWIAGFEDWEIMIAGRSWQRSVRDDGRDFVEVSLASLALTYPGGGDILLRVGGSELVVGRFSSPLQPVAIRATENDVNVGFRFDFSEPVVWIRPTIRELSSGKRWSIKGQELDAVGQCAFVIPELPTITFDRCENEQQSTDNGNHPICLLVPKRNWPDGLWIVEIETRRDEQSEWERVVLHGSEHAPVVLFNSPKDFTASGRASLFWRATAGESLIEVEQVDDEGRLGLFELLVELIDLRQRRLVSDANWIMAWLKPALRSISQLVGHIAGQSHSDGLQLRLLNLACQDESHAGFVYMPGLLALPSSLYRQLPGGDPLNDALRVCGSVGTSDSIAELAQRDFAFFDAAFLSCFKNFMRVVTLTNDDFTAQDFEDFDHQKYWNNVLGTIRSDHLASDWSGQNLLGRTHFIWSVEEFVRRYQTAAHDLQLGAANALLRSAPSFRAWLHDRLSERNVMSSVSWNAPWPRLEAPDVDFLESTPRFASLFGLAARAAALGWLDFDEALTWLEARVGRRRMAEQGIAVLVGLAPELFGYQLLFWESILHTSTNWTV